MAAKGKRPLISVNSGNNLALVLALVGFVQREHDRTILRQQLKNDLVARIKPVGFHDEDDHIDIRQGLLDAAVHGAIKRIGMLVLETGRINEDELRIGPSKNAHDPVPRRLRLARNDADFLADQLIQQRRLSDVRTSDNGDGSGFERAHDFSIISRARSAAICSGRPAAGAQAFRANIQLLDDAGNAEFLQMRFALSRCQRVFRQRQTLALQQLLQTGLGVFHWLGRIDRLNQRIVKTGNHGADCLKPSIEPNRSK